MRKDHQECGTSCAQNWQNSVGLMHCMILESSDINHIGDIARPQHHHAAATLKVQTVLGCPAYSATTLDWSNETALLPEVMHCKSKWASLQTSIISLQIQGHGKQLLKCPEPKTRMHEYAYAHTS